MNNPVSVSCEFIGWMNWEKIRANFKNSGIYLYRNPSCFGGSNLLIVFSVKKIVNPNDLIEIAIQDIPEKEEQFREEYRNVLSKPENLNKIREDIKYYMEK